MLDFQIGLGRGPFSRFCAKKLAEGTLWHRLGEVETLQFVTAEVSEYLALLFRFHPFCRDAQAFGMCYAYDGLDDRDATTWPVEGMNERPVDLDPIDLQPLQTAE